MGGKFFKCERMDRNTFLSISDFMMKQLESCVSNAIVIEGYLGKQSYGDIDILVVADSWGWLDKLIESIESCGRTVTWRKQSDRMRCLHLDGEYQVDLILCTNENLPNTYDSMRWGDLCVFVGEILHSLNCRFSPSRGFGLKISEFIDLQPLAHFEQYYYLQLDFVDVLEIIDLDLDTFYLGLNNEEEMFEYVSSSPYFHIDIFSLNHHNSSERKRMEERGSVARFLEWYASKGLDKRERDDFDRDMFMKSIESLFLRSPSLKQRMTTYLTGMLVESQSKPLLRKLRIEGRITAVKDVFGVDEQKATEIIRRMYTDCVLTDDMSIEETVTTIYNIRYKD